MQVDAYVQARYGRLLEHAIELGAPDGLAAEYVDEVLITQRRRIRRSPDPDPMVREALARAIQGRGDHGRGAGIAVGVVLGAVALVGGAALLFRPAPTPLPTLSGFYAAEAQSLLEQSGLDVQLRPTTACEPKDLVLATTPVAGTLMRPGQPVTVRVAAPYSTCAATYGERTDAWDLVRWARRIGPEPTFVADAEVLVDDRPTPLQEARRLIGEAVARPSGAGTGLVLLGVDRVTPEAAFCGVPTPADRAGATALRIGLDQVDAAVPPECLLTVDLYRDADGAIETLALYSAATLS